MSRLQLPQPATPAKYISFHALAVSDSTGAYFPASGDDPLPIRRVTPIPAPDVVGTAATGKTITPAFAAAADLAVWVEMSGDWAGRITVERSADEGANWHELTIGGRPWPPFLHNGAQAVALEGRADVRFRLVLDIVDGIAQYRIGQ